MKIIPGGAGGGGGGAPKAPKESPVSLRSNTILRAVEVLNGGPSGGVIGGLKGVYFNRVPIQNQDGTFNFQNVHFEERFGTASQTYLSGFPAIENSISVGAILTTTTPYTHTVSEDKDAVLITFQLPNGIYKYKSNNDRVGAEVKLNIYKRDDSIGMWVFDQEVVKNGTAVETYEWTVRVERPATEGNWSIKIERVTADSSSQKVNNATGIARLSEVIYRKNDYPNVAYCGLIFDAQSVGNQEPERRYRYAGKKVKYPSNYNPTTKTFSGQWDGTFNFGVCADPAWHLYDFLIDDIDGIGLDESEIDKWSFYDASVYNNGRVTTIIDGVAITEPRYTFNGFVDQRVSGMKLANALAGTFASTIINENGIYRVNQDRPASSIEAQITNADVIDGEFSYSSSGLANRYNYAVVTYNDKNDLGERKSTVVDMTTPSSDFSPVEVAAWGATTEAQAIRRGRYEIETTSNQTETVTWKSSFKHMFLRVGDVVEIFDKNYALTQGGGLIEEVISTTQFKIDREITGNKFRYTKPDGTITQLLNCTVNGNIVTLATPVAELPVVGSTYNLISTISPRKFRIITTGLTSPNIVTITGVEYDEGKYARIEGGVSVITPTVSVLQNASVKPVTNLQISPQTFITSENAIVRKMAVSWTASETKTVNRHIVKWRRDFQNFKFDDTIVTNSFVIDDGMPGIYDVVVYAIDQLGQQSPPTSASYTYTLDGLTTSALNPVTSLQVQNGISTTEFGGNDCTVVWTNPSANGNITETLKDFRVQILDYNTDVVRGTYYVAPVPAGQTQTFTYTYSENTKQTLARTFKVQVNCRDGHNNLSAPTTFTATNPAPPVPLNINVVGFVEGVKITFDPMYDDDWAGYRVWSSTTSGFTPDDSNLVYDGRDNYIALNGLTGNTTYYFRVAAYDTFGRTGLNLSSQLSGLSSLGFDPNTLEITLNSDNLTLNGEGEGGSASTLPTGWTIINQSSTNNTVTGHTAAKTATYFPGKNTWGLNTTIGATGATYWGMEKSQLCGSGWFPNKTYVISFWAKASGAALLANTDLMELRFGTTQPATTTWLNKPDLSSTLWQRYAVKITWGSTVEVNGAGQIVFPYFQTGTYTFDIASVMVTMGQYLSEYSAIPDGSIYGTKIVGHSIVAYDAIAQNTITDTLLANNAAINNIASNTITVDKCVFKTASGISANIGTINAGIIYNHDYTKYINMDAVNSSAYFIYSPGFWVRGDGYAYLNGAYIGDLTVTYLKIPGGGLTRMANGYGTDAILGRRGVTASCAILVQGDANVSIDVSGKRTVVSDTHAVSYIARNGTTLINSLHWTEYVVPSSGNRSEQLSFGIRDTPGAGTHTYTVYASEGCELWIKVLTTWR